MNELIPSFEFLAFICAGSAFVVAVLLVSVQKSLRYQLLGLRHTLAQESACRKQIEEDFRALLRCSQNMGKRLRDTKPREEPTIARSLNFNFDPAEAHVGDKVHELVERGLSVDEVASICGLTRGEVDFLSRFFEREISPRLASKADSWNPAQERTSRSIAA